MSMDIPYGKAVSNERGFCSTAELKKINPFNYQFPCQAVIKYDGCFPAEIKKAFFFLLLKIFFYRSRIITSCLRPESENYFCEVQRSVMLRSVWVAIGVTIVVL